MNITCNKLSGKSEKSIRTSVIPPKRAHWISTLSKIGYAMSKSHLKSKGEAASCCFTLNSSKMFSKKLTRKCLYHFFLLQPIVVSNNKWDFFSFPPNISLLCFIKDKQWSQKWYKEPIFKIKCLLSTKCLWWEPSIYSKHSIISLII